jgi:tartronate-semialdehyde synthase
MAKMKAAMAAVLVNGKRRHYTGLRRAGRGDQPVLFGAEASQSIRHVLARHVEGASHMAEGYTRAKAGNIGVCIGTSGPAGTDMITGLYSAIADSIPDPVHHRPGAARAAVQGRFPGGRHRAISKPVTKWAVTVMEP